MTARVRTERHRDATKPGTPVPESKRHMKRVQGVLGTHRTIAEMMMRGAAA